MGWVLGDVDIYRHRSFKRWSLHTKLVVCITAGLILLGAVFFIVVLQPTNIEWTNPMGKILGAIFQSVTSRTAGFNTIGHSGSFDASKFMTIILMFIGASPASTGGGIKTTTAR